ncbi:FAD-dependent thymidylate synthase [Streptomyces niveus]|uniref:FAD-dependent thymidylate synthase n=1 Tax=Streptomyces niveus TaxID=193462 RepID=UPI0033E0C6A2
MQVDILAKTEMDYVAAAWEDLGYEPYPGDEMIHEADALAELSGRLCYRSFNRPNPKTARNEDYLKNIIDQGHFSVLEHSSVTFLVRGVSRSLLAELTRHRHLSFSVVSQRYVDYSETEPVIPPSFKGTEGEARIREEYELQTSLYGILVKKLIDAGKSRKEAREAARAVLPNAAPVDMVVTGNLRAWRDVLGKRWHVAADVEICRLAGFILSHLRDIAPNSFQDIPDEPYGSEK